MNKSLFISFILLLTYCPAFSQNLETRMDKLEVQSTSLEEQMKLTNQTVEQKISLSEKSVSNQIEGVRTDFEKFKLDQKKESLLYKIILALGVIGGLGTIFNFFTRSAQKIALKEIKKKIANVVEDNRASIVEIIKKQSYEEQMMREKSILVLTKPGQSDSFLKSILSSFDHVDYNEEQKAYDLILFNSYGKTQEEQFTEKEIEAYAANKQLNHDKTVLFYFGFLHVKAEDVKERFASANFKSQVLGNLLNALKVQKSL